MAIIPFPSETMNLYLAECLTYGSEHPIKVGISKNPYKRMRHLAQMGISCPSLRAIFVFPNKSIARNAEQLCCKKFKRHYCGYMFSREILDAELKEIHSFVLTFKPLYSIILESHFYHG